MDARERDTSSPGTKPAPSDNGCGSVTHTEQPAVGRVFRLTGTGSTLLCRFLREREALFLEIFGYEMDPLEHSSGEGLKWHGAVGEVLVEEAGLVEALLEQNRRSLLDGPGRAGWFDVAVVRAFLDAMPPQCGAADVTEP